MPEYLKTFAENFIDGIPNLVTALLIFAAGMYLSRLIGNIIRRVLVSRKAPEGVTHLLSQLARWTFIIIGSMTALQQFFDVTTFLAGLGILGFTIGFALQDVMKNFAAGIILLLQQPFHVGDAIGVKEFEGTVTEIDLRTTEIKTFDGRIVILPNADMLANPIINYTRADRRRVDLPVWVSYNTDPEKARRAAREAIETVPGMVDEPAPMVSVSSLGDSGIELKIFLWIDTLQTNPVEARNYALTRIKAAFDKKGIDIPLLIQTMQVKPKR